MNYNLNIHNRQYNLSRPQVMGILNCTPDSFYSGSRKQTEEDIIHRVHEIISQGGTFIDVGAMSTRPGGTFVTEAEEMQRLRFALPIVTKTIAEAADNEAAIITSVDTYRPAVARMAVEEYGIDIINDVGAPENRNLHSLEHISREEMYRTIAQLHVPYILMASTATPDETLAWFRTELSRLHDLGAEDIILDPGYGFGKTIEQNYQHLATQQQLVDTFPFPLLAGVSRKRMIWQLLNTSPDEALNGTTVLNTLALQHGAAILRVHDVREAVECVKVCGALFSV